MSNKIVKYETGATSHAVNDLILFTDNTRELAQYRDNTYISMHEADLKTHAKEWSSVVFERLLNKARATYANECGGDNSIHIINMTDAEKEEYRQLYLFDYDAWKLENGYK